MSLENIIKKVEEEVQVFEEKLEGFEGDVEKLTSLLTKIIKNLLILSNSDVYEKIVKEYTELMREGEVIYANEMLVATLERPVRYAFTIEKSKQSKKSIENVIEDIVKKKISKFNFDNELVDKIVKIVIENEEPLTLICKAIDDSYLNALRELIANYIRITPYWKNYFSYIPGLTDYRVGYLITIAPPWRFNKFSAYRLYIGSAPRKVYQILGKHWHRKAKSIFYITFLLSLKNHNPYYKKIFSLRFDVNKMKILDEYVRETYNKSINELKDSEVEKLLKWFEISTDNKAKILRSKTFFYALKESVDIFAHHFWYITRKSLGLSVQKPYPIEYLKHEPYYKPAIGIPLDELVRKGIKPPATIIKKGRKDVVFVDVDTGELIHI